MGFLAPKKNDGQIPYYTGLQIQTSGNNVPISIVWGANKIAPNCIWTGGDYGYYGYAEGSTGGAKGGVGSSGSTASQSWQYYTSWAFGLCEGPITSLGTIWVGQDAKTPYGADIWGVFYGTQTQNPWAEWSGGFAGYALSYRGLAYITSFNYYLGSSNDLPQFAMEIHGLLFNSAGISGGDADCAEVIQDFLTNSQYGVGFPAASIDATTLFSPVSGTDSSYQGYCRANYFCMSPALTNQESANSILVRWLKLTNSAAVWSGGQLKFIPYGDSVVGPTPNQLAGNVTFTPNVTPVYSLGDDDFIHEDGKDPVEITRVDPFSLFNWQRIQISERVNSYIPVTTTPNNPWIAWLDENSYVQYPVDVWDQSAIEKYGLRMAPDINADEICVIYMAKVSAQLILNRQLYVRNYFKFKVSFDYCLLEPMDLINITDSALGLSKVTVRVTEIEEDDEGVLEVTCEEFPAGIATAVQYPTQDNQGNQNNQDVIPARVNAPIIFEPPASYTGGVAQVFIAVSGGVAPVYLLAETSGGTLHYCAQNYAGSIAYNSAITQTLLFQIYVQVPASNGRSAVNLSINNGSTSVGADFDLVNIDAVKVNAAVTAEISQFALDPVTGSCWYILSISTPLAGTGPVSFSVSLENPLGTTSYSGTAGYGVYIWGQEFGWWNSDGSGSEDTTFLPAFTSPVGATLATVGSATVSPPAGVAGDADQNWGGANVWLSTDGTTFTFAGQALGPSRQGLLSASLAAYSGSNPDTTDTLQVDLSESGGVLATVTATEASNGSNLCFINDSNPELLSFQIQSLVSGNTYNCTNLYRGLYATSGDVSHSSGAPFAMVDSSVFQYTLPAAYVGVEIYVKLQSFNSFGGELEDLSECAVYTYTPTGAGFAYGPVTESLILGTEPNPWDWGSVTGAAAETDNWGTVIGTYAADIDYEQGGSPP
jgi:hypothetical protein